MYACFETCFGKIVKPRTREVASKAGPRDDPMDVDPLVEGKFKTKAMGKTNDMASNQRAKERVRAIQSLMEHVTILVTMDTRQAIVGAPKAKANARTRKTRTARTRKANATKQQSWECLLYRNVESFKSVKIVTAQVTSPPFLLERLCRVNVRDPLPEGRL